LWRETSAAVFLNERNRAGLGLSKATFQALGNLDAAYVTRARLSAACLQASKMGPPAADPLIVTQ